MKRSVSEEMSVPRPLTTIRRSKMMVGGTNCTVSFNMDSPVNLISTEFAMSLKFLKNANWEGCEVSLSRQNGYDRQYHVQAITKVSLPSGKVSTDMAFLMADFLLVAQVLIGGPTIKALTFADQRSLAPIARLPEKFTAPVNLPKTLSDFPSKPSRVAGCECGHCG